jgi:hypothetical protein
LNEPTIIEKKEQWQTPQLVEIPITETLNNPTGTKTDAAIMFES